MLAKSTDALRNLIVYSTYDDNTQMKRHFTQHRTIEPFLSAVSKQYKSNAIQYAYDTGATGILAEAVKDGWTVVDMRSDWKVVYPPRKD